MSDSVTSSKVTGWLTKRTVRLMSMVGASVSASLIVAAVAAGSAQTQHIEKTVDWAYQGSVTACFEQKAVANEIEITKNSIERATRKVMGFAQEVIPEEASPEVCGLKLA